jgi:hypothetical protein
VTAKVPPAQLVDEEPVLALGDDGDDGHDRMPARLRKGCDAMLRASHSPTWLRRPEP